MRLLTDNQIKEVLAEIKNSDLPEKTQKLLIDLVNEVNEKGENNDKISWLYSLWKTSNDCA